MNNQTKIFIGVAVLGIVGYIVYRQNIPSINSATTGGATFSCKPPEIACANNPRKCYNPSINYLVDPCTS